MDEVSQIDKFWLIFTVSLGIYKRYIDEVSQKHKLWLIFNVKSVGSKEQIVICASNIMECIYSCVVPLEQYSCERHLRAFKFTRSTIVIFYFYIIIMREK